MLIINPCPVCGFRAGFWFAEHGRECFVACNNFCVRTNRHKSAEEAAEEWNLVVSRLTVGETVGDRIRSLPNEPLAFVIKKLQGYKLDSIVNILNNTVKE